MQLLQVTRVTSIPWRDQAVLIRTSAASIHDGGRAIVAEGPLHRVLAIADELSADEVERHYITLPDRRVAPFRYDGEAIRTLLGRLDRPGAFDLFKSQGRMVACR